MTRGSRANNYWTKRKCDLLTVRNVRRRIEGGALEYLMHPPVEHHTLYEDDDCPAQVQATADAADNAEDLVCEECGDSNYIAEVVKCVDCTTSCCICCRKHYDCMRCKTFFVKAVIVDTHAKQD